ncbi:MAG TPA: serine/threonine-protein kinase [Actinomycetota bacterium]|nr:serine/threonine-protein kinase [Actinomycetota bacterium]
MGPGDVVHDRYRLRAPIGRGGMAQVWRADDERLQRPVAIKFLSPHVAQEPDNLVRFFSEAQSVARITHPGVVTVLDFGQHDDRPFLVMEYLPGGSLADVATPVDVGRACAIVARVAAAAGAAHAAGIVHRDVKPANVLLDDTGTPKLADFGIASARGHERLTATGTAVGSPHYVSPEQAMDVGTSPASDVYALGVVLYELVTGTRPFDGDSIAAIVVGHVEREPRRPGELVDGLDPTIEAVILRCLEKSPEDRYATGTELATALDAVTPATARAGVPPTAVLSSAAAVAAGSSFAVGDAAARDAAADAGGDDPVRRRRGRPRRVLVAACALVAVVAAVLATVVVAATSGDGAVATTTDGDAGRDDRGARGRDAAGDASPAPDAVENAAPASEDRAEGGDGETPGDTAEDDAATGDDGDEATGDEGDENPTDDPGDDPSDDPSDDPTDDPIDEPTDDPTDAPIDGGADGDQVEGDGASGNGAPGEDAAGGGAGASGDDTDDPDDDGTAPEAEGS